MKEMNKYVPRFLSDVSHETGCSCAALARVSAELNLQKCLGPRFQRLGGSMSFLIVEKTLTQITALSLQNMWLHIQRMVVGTGDLF